MAKYTILRNSDKSNSSDVIIEFVVPASSNVIGVPWRSIVSEVRAESGSVGSTNPRMRSNSTHIAKLNAGQLIEVPLTVEYDANLQPVEKLAILDAVVTAKVADFTTEFASLYEFYGTTRTV